MNGGQRYWNEETQRWEDGTRETAHATPPPPGRPDHEPTVVVPSGDDEGILPPAGSEPPVTPPPPAPWPSGPGWPPADQPSAPTADRFERFERFDRRRVWAAVVAGAAVVGVTVGLVLTQTSSDGDDSGRDQKAAGSVTPTDPASTYTSESPTGEVPQETSSPTLTAAQLPTGYESFDDPEGFRTAVPEGWERDSMPSQYGMDVVNFRSPDGEQRIQVFQVAEATPQESFDLFLSPDTPKSDSFRELGRQDLSDGDFAGERLEYLVDSIRGEPDGGTWHVVDTRFAATDGTLYAVAVYGRDADGRSDEIAMSDTAVGWFCPPGATCAG
ncbi:hypothetical protein E0500_013925 [Streptomyces sp. KM273126]|uniref:hypothetical protein n=1 Tax=Streptomyces sp. KM273126 TaxID=2545247 RepID=UPI0010401249|nr:hypothetical protein [Streptomyces sp. KM273126]MBA2808472.1 hypothetical protein [Streptomyces sp. KM273126]